MEKHRDLNLPPAVARARLDAYGDMTLRVFGGSMLPSIWPGCVVRIDTCDGQSVSIGDVVLYERNAKLVLHRIVGRTDGGLRARGDSHDREEGPLQFSAVMGRVRGVVVGRWHFDAVPDGAARAIHRAWLAALPAARPLTRIARYARRRLRAL